MTVSFKSSIGVIALLSIVFPAVSADLPSAPVASPIPPPPTFSWTGFYAGLGFGGRWSEADWTTTCLQPTFVPGCNNTGFPGRFSVDNPSIFDQSGFRVNAYYGYNWQLASWVIGLEGDIAWADTSNTHTGIPGTHLAALTANDFAAVRDTWDASIRGRLGGLITPQALLYVTGGISWIQKELTASCATDISFAFGGWCAITPQVSSFSKTLFGWTVGGGIEWMFAPNWIARAEYRFSDYTSDGLSVRFFVTNPIDSFDAVVDQKTHTAYVGVSYLFNWAPATRY